MEETLGLVLALLISIGITMIHPTVGAVSLIGVLSFVVISGRYLKPNTPEILQFGDGAILIEERKNKDVPLYVYTGVAVSSRRWNSFHDRRHALPKSPLIEMIRESHLRHHHIGGIVEVTDEMLLAELPEETRKEIAGVRGDVSLQHERLLRDSLLFKLICKTGGILIPANALLMRQTDEIWKQVLLGKPGTVFYAGEANSEYGAPIIATQGGSECQRIADLILEAGRQKEFMGGVLFGGGSTLLLNRISRQNLLQVSEIGEVGFIRTDVLVEIGELPGDLRGKAVIVIPFPQGSGETSIPRKDEWIYVTNEFSQNPLVITDLLQRSGVMIS